MMTELSKDLREALEADEAGDLDRVLLRKRKSDFEALRSLLSLDSTSPADFRTKAIYALGRWGEASVVPDIIRLLPELDEHGRIGALSALGHLGVSDATDAVIKHSDDPSPQVRKAAALALSRIGTPDASAKLLELADSDPLPWIRELAGRLEP